MKKNILLISYNFSPELTGIGKYNGEMIYWLAENGYDCTVITTYPYYPYWKVQEPYEKDHFKYKTEELNFTSGGKIIVHRCPMYVPAQPTGAKRILLDLSFIITVTFKLLQLLFNKKYDVVFTVAPSFQIGILGVLCKIIRDSRFIYHVQDMQIEAARDLQLIKSKATINLLFKIERFILRNADKISSISSGMINKLKDKSNKNVFLFPNWTDTKFFYPIENRLELKEEFGFKTTDKIILYSGAIGEKQGLEAILEAANAYRNESDLKFVICGSGPYKQRLQDLSIKLNLQNTYFIPLQGIDKFNKFLNIADVHLVIQKSTTSDLVMPSKVTTILAVGGLAIVTADEGSSLYSLIKKYNMGILIKSDCQQALNDGILKALSENNESMTVSARIYAEKYLSIDKIMPIFINNVNL